MTNYFKKGGCALKRWDRLLLLALLGVGAAMGALLFLLRSPGATVTVTVDNVQTAAFPLEEAREYRIETEYGTNLLVIADGTARLTEADCPDLLCVKQGSIRYAGDSIICLPHKLVVEITGDAPDGVDAVAK